MEGGSSFWGIGTCAHVWVLGGCGGRVEPQTGMLVGCAGGPRLGICDHAWDLSRQVDRAADQRAGVSLTIYAHAWVPGGWRGRVPGQHVCQRTGSGSSVLGTQVGGQG